MKKIKTKRKLQLAFSAFGIAAFASFAQAGEIITQPYLQNVYTNRFTVMCETSGRLDGLALQYGAGYADSAAMSCTNGLKDGTWIYRTSVDALPEQGATVAYRLATNGVAVAGTEGSVKLWKDEDAAFTCSVWGDNQEGVQEYDWGFDNTTKRYQCIRSMFKHMADQKPDFGFSTGDYSSNALYDEEIEPGELRGAIDRFGRTIPFHLVWGNHDCNGKSFGTYTNAVQRYFAPAATEDEGWFHLYRNDVLFIGVHWVWGRGDAETRYDAITNGIARLLATERAKNAKFRIIMQHAPVFLECWNVLPKIDWFSDTRLLDVARAGGVDLIFSGHTHSYEHIERDGLVQVVNGGMGYLDHGERTYQNYGSGTKAGGHQDTPLLWARQDENGELDAAEPVRMGSFQGYGMLSVTDNTLTYKAHAFDANGGYIGVADAFTLESRTAGTQGTAEAVVPFAPSALTAPVNNATWAEFKTSQGEGWTKPAGAGDEDPVVNVSKTEVERFCAALNAGKSTSYRLPTVAELTAAFGGDLERDVSEWTCDVDPNTGWCRILGGNKQAVDYTWCRAADKPAMASPDCHADYLGFRVVDDAAPIGDSPMDKALAALAKITEPFEVYRWNGEDLEDITDDWTDGKLGTKYAYTDPVIFTGAGALAYNVGNDITFGGGVAAPKATSLDFSHVAGGNKVTVKGEFRGGVATDDWRFYLKCDELTLDNVTYRGQVFNAVTDDRSVALVGANDFSGAVMSVGVDSLISKLVNPGVKFVTNLVADAAATLALRRLDFTTRGVAEEVLAGLAEAAGFTVGENVTLVTAENVLFGIKGAMLAVDGTLEAAGVDIAGHLMGLLPQEATVLGAGTVKTTHFGMCEKSTLYVGVSNVTLQSSVPYRTYTDCVSTCNVERLSGASPTVERERDNKVSTNGIVKVKDLDQAIKSKKAGQGPALPGAAKSLGKKLVADPLTDEFYAPKNVESVVVSYSLSEDSAKRFADGTKEKTFKMALDKQAGSWKLEQAIDAAKDLATGTPTFQFGVVAQRYPWNGTVDVNYRATFWPAGQAAAVEVTVGKTVVTNITLKVAGRGTVVGVLPVTMPAETKGKATFRVVED